ncbi:MAG: segregation and condensation protein A [Phycisphaerae bacterium]
MNQGDYRVELDVYNGPLELLLFLIRKEEVDIHDIPIARITSQYLAHVELIRHLDVDLAGEFLVLAATLMEIKSRMLNPQPVSALDAGVSTQDLSDPRRELVEQLLQYKQFKDAANTLARRAEVEQQRFGRSASRAAGRTPLDLDDINLFALIDAFNAIMASVGHSAFGHDVVYDDTPIGLHQADILDRLTRDGPLTLQAMFAGRKSRSEMIGLFLAMLELIRMKKICVEQLEADGAIGIRLNPDAPSAELPPPENLPPKLPETQP